MFLSRRNKNYVLRRNKNSPATVVPQARLKHISGYLFQDSSYNSSVNWVKTIYYIKRFGQERVDFLTLNAGTDRKNTVVNVATLNPIVINKDRIGIEVHFNSGVAITSEISLEEIREDNTKEFRFEGTGRFAVVDQNDEIAAGFYGELITEDENEQVSNIAENGGSFGATTDYAISLDGQIYNIKETILNAL